MPSVSCFFLLVFTSLKINTKRSPIDVPIFDGFLWTKRSPRSKRVGPEESLAIHEGAPGPLGAPWLVVLPSEHPQGASPAHWMSSGPKKSTKIFAAFGLRLVLISCDVKNMQKIATCTWHYVNRLVPKNDIK